jgi:hypothetical protein
MTQTHPITPPPELVQQWASESLATQNLCNRAAQWGADQELEACIADIHTMFGKGHADWLRSLRRPKPQSLKEVALALVEQHEEGWRPSPKDWDTIRRALEALDG